MATSTAERKRKREIQDENTDLEDNFSYLRHLGEQKRRRLQDTMEEIQAGNVSSHTRSCAPRLQPLRAVHDFSRANLAIPKKFEPEPVPKSLRALRRLSLPVRPAPIKLPPRSPPHKPHIIPEELSPSKLMTPPTSCLGGPMRQPDSLKKMRRTLSGSVRKPLKSLRGSIRGKVAEQVRASVMRGKQDYALPNVTGQLDYLRFLTAQQDKSGDPQRKLDVQLQQKIDHEIKMRDGTAKLLAASKHPNQLLEAAKNLLTSNSRMIAYMSELQRRKTDEVLKRNKPDANNKPGKAKVAVSDVRIPLMWKDSDHFKNKGDHRRYAVFCLWKIGTEIFDTTLIKDVDRSMTDLTYDDVIVFEDISPDFECQLEVYCHKLCDDHSMASTPRRLKKKFNEISTSVGRSVGRRLSGMKEDTEFMANMIVGPRFELLASATLTLKDVRDSIGIFDLPTNNSAPTDTGGTELPLFGHFCCRLVAQPHCLTKGGATGMLNVKVSTEPWRPLWCILENQTFSCWPSEGLSNRGNAIVEATLTQDCRVRRLESPGADTDDQSGVVQLAAWSNGRRRHYQLASPDSTQLDKWVAILEQHILNLGAWKQACETVMVIEQTTPPNRRSLFGHRPRSLYEDIPLGDAQDDSPMTRVLNRLHVDDVGQ